MHKDGKQVVETAVEATRLGAFDFVEKPLSLAKLLRTVERALDAGKRRRQSGKLIAPPLMVPVGKSRLMQQLRTQLQQIAAHSSAVLLVGEPGSGREAGARYLHEHSGRNLRPFVALIASTLREADAPLRLFGREEGGHAAENENAFIMAIDPSLVHKERYNQDMVTANPSPGTWSACPSRLALVRR